MRATFFFHSIPPDLSA